MAAGVLSSPRTTDEGGSTQSSPALVGQHARTGGPEAQVTGMPAGRVSEPCMRGRSACGACGLAGGAAHGSAAWPCAGQLGHGPEQGFLGRGVPECQPDQRGRLLQPAGHPEEPRGERGPGGHRARLPAGPRVRLASPRLRARQPWHALDHPQRLSSWSHRSCMCGDTSSSEAAGAPLPACASAARQLRVAGA